MLSLSRRRSREGSREREGVVRVARFRSGVAVGVGAGGVVAASGLPALAAPAVGPTVTIAAKSLFRPVTGDVFVVFNAAKFSNAQIHGSISGATAGNVARLFVQPFPFKNAPTRAGSRMLTGPAAPYSFTVTPTLATRYRVELFANSTSTSPLRTSAVVTVFVANKMTLSGLKACSRPVCRQRIRVQEQVPASTLGDEISKRWFFYFGLNRSPTTP